MIRSSNSLSPIFQVSAKTHYAVVAMVDLASQSADGDAVSLRQIADRHGIPLPFLTQIFQGLRSAGLVVSTRGSAGGYRLRSEPSAITVADIVQAVGGKSESSLETNSTEENTAVQAVWCAVNQWVEDHLGDLTLQALVDRLRVSPESMFYI